MQPGSKTVMENNSVSTFTEGLLREEEPLQVCRQAAMLPTTLGWGVLWTAGLSGCLLPVWG